MLWPHIERIIAGAGGDYNLRTIPSFHPEFCIAVFWNNKQKCNFIIRYTAVLFLPISSCKDDWTMIRYSTR